MRTHRISVAWLYERFRQGDLKLVYEESAKMCADIYTKAFTDVSKWNEVRDLIGVLDQNTLKELQLLDTTQILKNQSNPNYDPTTIPSRKLPRKASEQQKKIHKDEKAKAKAAKVHKAQRPTETGQESSDTETRPSTILPENDTAQTIFQEVSHPSPTTQHRK